MKKILLHLLMASSLFAQMPDIQFENITSADGLVDDDFVIQTYQDRQGFIWLLTSGGLSRYDGYSFKNYQPDAQDSTSLQHGLVRTIYEDHNGQLWIGGGNQGLSRFNPATEEFFNYKHDENDSASIGSNGVHDIQPDGELGLWIATGNGLDHFDFETNSFTHFKHDPNDSLSLSSNNLQTLYVDKNNTLWVGAGTEWDYLNNPGGLNRFDRATKTFKHYFHNPDNECSLADNQIFSISEDHDGELYIGTGMATLHRYNREKDCFERLSSQSKNLPYAPSGKGFAGFRAIVWNVFQDSKGIFWTSTFSGGLNRFDLKKDIMIHYPNEKNKDLQLGSKAIINVYEDRQGTKWIGTAKAGLYKVIPSRKRFHPLAHNESLSNLLKTKDIRVLYEDSEQTFWIATSNDLFRFDPATGKIKNYSETFDFQVKWLDSIYEDDTGDIWFSGSGIALNRIDLKTGKVKRFTPNNSNIASWGIINIIADGDTALWVCSQSAGLMRFELKSEKFKRYTHNPENQRSLSSNGIWTSYLDKKNDLWIATGDGLNRLNKETDDFDRFLPGVEIHTILQDRNNIFWLGTLGNGLIRFNKELGEYAYFTTEHGLQDNRIFALVEDNQGYIWIGTTVGLSRLDPKTLNIISYKKEDGLLSQLSVYADAVLKTSNGKLLFGGNKGITTFSPEDFKMNNSPPYVVITGLSIFDKPYKEKGSLDSVIILAHNQNDLTFDYVSLHFKNPKKNLYKVKLKPYETEWSEANKDRKVRYTNLAPDEYSFQVQASNSDGVWNEEGKKLTIIINPPFWATWWAYIFYLLFGLGLLFSIRKFELNNRKEKENKRFLELENKRKSEELEEARQLQLSMLPKELPKLQNFEIAVHMQTATEVGGDYYDFSNKEDGSLNIAIGDATGHGMKAGIMVSSMKSIFTTNSPKMDIESFFATANSGVKSMRLQRMMMGFIMLNINKNRFQLINAGMPPIFLYRKKSKSVEEITEHGLPIGAMSISKYNVCEDELKTGDVLLLMTDGMPELHNDQKEMYGYERIHTGFEKVAEKGPDKIIEFLKKEGTSWVNNQAPDDDVTFVVIKVK